MHYGRYIVLVALLAATTLSGTARAQAPRLHPMLTWNDCGVPRDTLERFACGTDPGSHRLIVRFAPEAGWTRAIREVEATFELWPGDPGSPGNALPQWWNFSTCRPTTDLVVGTAAPPGCAPSLWTNQTFSLVQTESFPALGPTKVKVSIVCADTIPAVPGTEYTVLTLDIKNLHTATCGGCEQPVGIILRWLQFRDDSGGLLDYNVTFPLNDGWVSWQCAGYAVPDVSYGYDAWLVNDPACLVPTRPSTWGRLKTTYR